MFNQIRLKFTFIAFFILLAFILFDIFQLQTTEFQSTSEIIDQQNLDKFILQHREVKYLIQMEKK